MQLYLIANIFYQATVFIAAAATPPAQLTDTLPAARFAVSLDPYPGKQLT